MRGDDGPAHVGGAELGAGLGFGLVRDAEAGGGHGFKTLVTDWLTAGIALAVRALVELAQGPIDVGQGVLQATDQGTVLTLLRRDLTGVGEVLVEGDLTAVLADLSGEISPLLIEGGTDRHQQRLIGHPLRVAKPTLRADQMHEGALPRMRPAGAPG